MAKFAKRLFAGALAAAVALTTVISSDMTALAAKTKATKIKGSTYTTADLIWEDNFNGDKLNTKYWNYEAHEPGWVNQEWQSYPSQEENEKTQNIYVKDGKLTIQAKKTKNEDGTYSYTSGRINTQNKVDTKYGRFEARIKMPKGKGFLPAFWMMPTDENLYGQWPKCGEIDITEVLGDKPNTAHSTLHFGEPHKQKQGTYTLEKGTFNDDFHVYACEWEPGEMRFYIDNKLFYTENDWFTKKEGFDEVAYPAPYDQPFYIILNLAVGGSWVGYPDKTTKFDENAQMVVDYVKVYQKDSYKENVKKPENKVTVRKPAKDGNYVVNSNFAKSEKLNDGKDWEFMTAGTGKASAKISKKALHITTKDAGDLDYSVQVVQANIPMEKGYQYKLSFDAYADKNRTIKTGITAPDNGYIRYFNDTTVNLTTKKKTYSYTFDMKSDTDPNGRVEFNLGNQGSTAGVHISNVKVVRVKKISLKEEKTVRPDGNYVYNGEFQEGADRLNYWTVKKAKGATVKVTNTNNVRQLKAVVPASVKKASDVTLKQTKIAIKGGKTYAFSFDAKRTGAKDQTLTVKVAGKTYKVKLTGKMKNYKFELKPDKGIKNATLEFQLGTKGTTVIDNVRIMESGLIINGDFSAGLTGFEPWANNPSDISYVVDTLNEDSAFCMDIKDTGDQDWHVQLKQTGIKLEKGQSYKVSFKVKGTMERDIKFAFQRNGLVRKTADGAEDWTVYFEDGQIPVTKKWTTYSTIFEMGEDDDADTSMSFSLGAVGGKRITDKHTVMIDDIVLEKTDEKPKKEEDDSLILNGKFDKGLAPFEAWADTSAVMESTVQTIDKNKVFAGTITNTGTEDWHVQLKQVDIPLEKDQYYTFSFRAKSDMDRNIKYVFQRNGGDWQPYFEESNIPVTKEWKTYTTVFKMTYASDKASFSFNFGKIGKQITDKHTVMIDDVSLKVATEEEKKQVKNASTGGWSSGPSTRPEVKEEQLDKAITKWKVEVKNDGAAAGMDAAGKSMIITNLGNSKDSLVMKADVSYQMSSADVQLFTAKITSNQAKKITIKDTKTGHSAEIDLTNGVNNVSCEMRSTGANIKSLRALRAGDDSSSIQILCGKHGDERISGESLVITVEDAKVTDCRLIKEEAPFASGWKLETWAGGSGSASFTNTTATVKVNAVGKEDSSVKLVKERIKLKAGQKYKVSFDVTSNPERKITWGIMNHPGGDTYTDWQAGANNIKAASNTHYDAEFECKKDSNTYQIYFSLGQMYEQNAEYELVKDRPIETKPSTVTISNLKIDLVVPETKPVSDNLIQNGDFSDKDKSWTSSIVSPGAATARFGGAAVYDITNVGTEDWNVQLKQAGLPIVTGSSYVVSFTAISTKARTIKSSIMAVSGDAYAWLGGEDVLLKENEPSNVVFYVKNVPENATVKVNEKDVDVNIATADKGIFFSMGQIKDTGYTPGDTPASTITISGITMKKISNEDAADKEDTQSNPGTKPGQGNNNSVTIGDGLLEGIVVNNIFKDVAAGTVEKTPNANEAKITITNSGNAADSIQIEKVLEGLEVGATYEYSFKIKANREWNIGSAMQKTVADWGMAAAAWPALKANVECEVKQQYTHDDHTKFLIQLGHKPTDQWNATESNVLGEGESVTITISNLTMTKIMDAPAQMKHRGSDPMARQ